jgi:hypothetical protein
MQWLVSSCLRWPGNCSRSRLTALLLGRLLGQRALHWCSPDEVLFSEARWSQKVDPTGSHLSIFRSPEVTGYVVMSTSPKLILITGHILSTTATHHWSRPLNYCYSSLVTSSQLLLLITGHILTTTATHHWSHPLNYCYYSSLAMSSQLLLLITGHVLLTTTHHWSHPLNYCYSSLVTSSQLLLLLLLLFITGHVLSTTATHHWSHPLNYYYSSLVTSSQLLLLVTGHVFPTTTTTTTTTTCTRCAWSWSYVTTDCQSASLILVSGFHLESMTIYLFSVWKLRISWFEATSLTRG